MTARSTETTRCFALIRMTAAAVGLLASSAVATAQPIFDVRHTFASPGGAYPYASLVQGTDGIFYGTTITGGDGNTGTAFRMDTAGNMTFLHDFLAYPGDPAYPHAAMIQLADGNFYGASSEGGSLGVGTIFKMTPAGVVTILKSLEQSADGGFPISRIVQGTDGHLYGTNRYYGPGGQGTAFRITLGGTYTVLHAFQGGTTDGGTPLGGLIQASDGNFYGTTSKGGPTDNGTIFRMTPAGTVTLLHTFSGAANGDGPRASLIQGSDGKLYGTTPAGGGSSGGTAFSITTDGTFAVLHHFNGSVEGTAPHGRFIQASDGNFYTTARTGGTFGLGTIFRMTAAGAVTTLHNFNIADGILPLDAVIQASDGHFYGTAYFGGAHSAGTAFKLTSGGTFSVLRSFTAGPEGARPRPAMTVASDGNLYGTNSVGGGPDVGTIFRMTPSGVFTVVKEFQGILDGQLPIAGLVQGTDGNFYSATDGTTVERGEVQNILFRMSLSGTFTPLHTMDPATDGSTSSTLIQASDGNFYGTTQFGGAGGLNRGTVFRMTSAGAVTVLRTFAGGTGDGASPIAALVQGTDGSLYGTTQAGGTSNNGTLFKITTAGTFTLLHSFTSATTGASPQAPLIQASDGNFYGTTRTGGASSLGTVFRMTPAGAVTVLHSFPGGAGGGANPYAPLVQTVTGDFFGTTSAGGTSNLGTVFRMTPAGAVTILHSFNGTNGRTPYAGLTPSGAGNFFGTTFFGGTPGAAFGGGVIFHISTFTDDPLTAGATVIQAAHIMELRSRVDSLRGRFGLGGFAYAEAVTAGTSSVKASHITELRTALAQAYSAAGQTPPTYTDPTLTAGMSIRAVHVTELRTRVTALE